MRTLRVQLCHCEPCGGKWSYASRRAANQARRALHPGHRGLQAYRCPVADHYWHLGHRIGAKSLARDRGAP